MMRQIEIISPGHPMGRKVLNIYLVENTRCYGGPEEGGWYYDRRFIIKRFRGRMATAMHRAKLLQHEHAWEQPRYSRFSVCGSYDLEIYITESEMSDEGSMRYE